MMQASRMFLASTAATSLHLASKHNASKADQSLGTQIAVHMLTHLPRSSTEQRQCELVSHLHTQMSREAFFLKKVRQHVHHVRCRPGSSFKEIWGQLATEAVLCILFQGRKCMTWVHKVQEAEQTSTCTPSCSPT
eukprot:1157087-Pelagomonas_calceolata.AAC.14